MIYNYKIIFGNKDTIHTTQTEVKKSKFISYIKKIENEAEATEFINQIKKKHYDASHNCSAFVLGKKKEIIRSSDDGEPSGTAGKPMLDVLVGSDIVNIVAVVTRYFGGTELGRGGLTRAYSGAVLAGLEELPTAIMTLGKRIKINTDYNTIGNILHLLETTPIEESEYTDVITLTLTIELDKVDEIINNIRELSSAKSTVEILEEVYFEKLDSWKNILNML